MDSESAHGVPADEAGLTTTRERDYAYGPANGLPDTKVGTFSQSAGKPQRRRHALKAKHEG